MPQLPKPLLLAALAVLLAAGGCTTPQATSTDRELPPGQVAAALASLAGTEPPSRSEASLRSKFRPEPADMDALIQALYAQPRYTSWFESTRFARGQAAVWYKLLSQGQMQIGEHAVVQLPADPTWREDPLNERNWVSQFHQLRWLLPAIWVARDGNDPDALALAWRYVKDYLQDNPMDGWRYPWGDQRTAERAKVMVTLFETLRERKLLTPENARLLVGSLWEYGALLATRQFYSFDSNHGLFQNEALLEIALAFPGFRDSAGWRNLAMARMDDQLVRNVSPAGIHREASTGYHTFTLSHFQDYVTFLAEHSLPVSAAMVPRLLGMVEYLLVICRPDGTYPMIGDSEREKAPFAVMDAVLAALDSCGATAAEPPLRQRSQRCRRMLQYVRSGGAEGSWPPERSFAYRDDGYFILRPAAGGPPEKRGMLFFCAEPTGPSLHGHLDALNICYNAGGQDFLVDSGKFTYAADARREFFRSTAAHSTILINDASYTEAKPRVIDVQLGGGFDYVEAEHGGYPKVTCNRAICHTADGWAVVVDEIRSEKPVSCRILWQLHPDAKLSAAEGESVAVLGDRALHIIPLAGASSREVVRGRSSPMGGWISFKYGELTPRDTLSYSAGGTQTAVVTLLVPTAADAVPVRAQLIEQQFGGRYAVRIEHGGRVATVRIDKTVLPRRVEVDVRG